MSADFVVLAFFSLMTAGSFIAGVVFVVDACATKRF